MKKINSKYTFRKLAGILSVSCLLLLTGCNPTGEKAETDYVNEIEAAENKTGDVAPVDDNVAPEEQPEVAPADVETGDSVSVVGDDELLND